MKDREWKIKKPMLFAEKYGILILDRKSVV